MAIDTRILTTTGGPIDLTIANNVTYTNEYSFIPSNYLGYASGILNITSATDGLVISMGWRPLLPSPMETRILPLYVDMERSDLVIPNFAIFLGLTANTSAPGPLELTERTYPFFLANPQTPTALPLLVDQSGQRLGLEICLKIVNQTGGQADFEAGLHLLFSELT